MKLIILAEEVEVGDVLSANVDPYPGRWDSASEGGRVEGTFFDSYGRVNLLIDNRWRRLPRKLKIEVARP